ncbi:gluzincin family metallopeptidase [Cochleicola gelatinilyticus]|uniref:Metalloprotease n=1 Tax=Cochleicola gelatinilyticus TaxID=1763537 RepID=A0A167HQA9_9FLAO|nr:metalloprotease [Cochleicola gelatinilyticus]OAB78851.1 metalloprotease [Cochleicola gelatinilyticus]
MKLTSYIFVIICGIACSVSAQQPITINAVLDPDSKTIAIEQEIVFRNNSTVVLDTLYFNDWANSFSNKKTPLAKRFGENYDSSFHFEKNDDRGNTTIHTVIDTNNSPLVWERGDEVDILKIALRKGLMPGEKATFTISYTVKVPDVKFTRFGVDKDNNYRLRYWYISPAEYDYGWEAYSNKNTDDLYLKPSEFNITFTAPERYLLTSELDEISQEVNKGMRTTQLRGNDRMKAILFLNKQPIFETIKTDKVAIVTNRKDAKVSREMQALFTDRVVHFLDEKLGSYPFKKLIVSDEAYRNSPVYGLNQLPDFISPFPDGFEYDMEQLKTITRSYLENTLALHPREDAWLIGALQIYLMRNYVDVHYPKMKIIGDLSDFWIIRWAHAADLEFNDQYPLLYLNMARNNLHQKITTPRDSLTKFNKNIANDYYGGSGLIYLADYLGGDTLDKSIKSFFSENKTTPIKSYAFQRAIEENTTLPVDWFFEDYTASRTTIDFKIKKVARRGDSLEVEIKNLKGNTLPVSLYGINKDSIIFKTWSRPISNNEIITVPAKDVRKLVLNYEGKITEFNQRNNYKAVKGLLNRPIQFRLFQDVEDPAYNQLFFMPIFEYNLYDGLTAGVKLYNKTVLPKGLHYKLEPQFGFRSKTLVGNGSVVYTQRLDQDRLYSMRYGLSGSYYSYDENLFYKRFTPFMTFAFRNRDLRDNEKQFINIRNINVLRDENPNDPDQDPNYSVLDVQYVYSNPNLINYFRGEVDYQVSSKFSKVSATFEYRKLFNNNRQLNLRMYAGAFIFNDTQKDGNFFNFALDRPSDYLFDYNYYGRSEDTGLFSQQLIVAEGGFKSQLEPAFADSWITTINASTNIWKWIYAYGDAGLIHNKGTGTQAVFDSGIRLSLVADYFELYFPMYSNLGFEPNLPDYDQKIRFIVTLSPKTLLSLFTREWY